MLALQFVDLVLSAKYVNILVACAFVGILLMIIVLLQHVRGILFLICLLVGFNP